MYHHDVNHQRKCTRARLQRAYISLSNERYSDRRYLSVRTFPADARTLTTLTDARLSFSQEDLQKVGDVQALISQLYEAFHVREYNAEMEKSVVAELEDIRLQLVPLEQVNVSNL